MISKQSCGNLNAQGYIFLSEKEKDELNFALRVTPTVCIALTIAGLYYQSIIIFITLSVFAFLGAVTSKGQPIDVFYNLFAKITKRVKLPPSPAQKRFACAVGMFFLVGASVSIYLGSLLWMYIFALAYIVAAGVMMLTHFCIASLFYNYIFKK